MGTINPKKFIKNMDYFEDLEEINAFKPAAVGVEFEFEEVEIKLPEFKSDSIESISIEENEALLYKFLTELKFKLKINLVSKEGKKCFSSSAHVTPCGEFKINYSDNAKTMAEGKYSSDSSDTSCTFYYGNGLSKRLEGNYYDGKKNGLIKEYYPNGLIKSTGNYLCGNKHDKKFQEFNESGELIFFGVYEHGKKITNLCEWVEHEYKHDLDDDINNLKNCIRHFDWGSRDPKKMLITKYDKRRIESVEYWNPQKKQSTGFLLHKNGLMKYKGRIVQGKMSGQGEIYHPNGVLKYKGNFVDNHISGEDVCLFHDNYELKYRGPMQQGKISGDN